MKRKLMIVVESVGDDPTQFKIYLDGDKERIGNTENLTAAETIASDLHDLCLQYLDDVGIVQHQLTLDRRSIH